MKLKVICIDNKYYPASLILGKEYEAEEKDGFYSIEDEEYEDYLYPKELFKIKE